jgi:hypothetical protein
MERFTLGSGLTQSARPEPYRRRPDDPVRRVLRVYTQDPGTSKSDGAIAEVELPWEPCGPGPSGHIFVVRDVHKPTGDTWAPIDLDDFRVTVEKGLAPSTTNPRFAQQMTYAVAMSTYERFRMALGRLPEFAPAVTRRTDKGRIEIRPHWDHEDNAYYEPDEAALSFGYVTSGPESVGATQPGAYVFTCLSHDIIAHETAHAILDGLRPHLMRPSNPDVAAFHEGFSDLVALLMRFRYRDVVRRGLEESTDESLDSPLLTDMAKQWGRTDGDGRAPLRRILYRQGAPDDPVDKDDRYDKTKEHHDLGAVLVAAIFEAMSRIFRKKTRTLRKIAAQSPGSRDHLIELLTVAARDLAGQFLNIVIRAVDYCPPVDITFGEFLRALVTADWVTVPADPYHYREALVLAFRRYGITVPGVPDLSEEALLWKVPETTLPRVDGLSFADLRHRFEPGWFAEPGERRARAEALGRYVTADGRHRFFGLRQPGRSGELRYDVPVVESVRTLRRLTPDDDLDFHTVAEVTQRVKKGSRWYWGGSTVVIDADGSVRFVIGKGVARLERHHETDLFLARAPREYQQAFEQAEWSPGAVIRRFHSRSSPRTKKTKRTAGARRS